MERTKANVASPCLAQGNMSGNNFNNTNASTDIGQHFLGNPLRHEHSPTPASSSSL